MTGPKGPLYHMVAMAVLLAAHRIDGAAAYRTPTRSLLQIATSLEEALVPPGAGDPAHEWSNTDTWRGHGFALFRGDRDKSSPKTAHPFWQFEASYLRRSDVYICCAVLFIAGILCSAGGIGGGGIYVTLLMFAGKMGVTDAVPLSKAIIFIGSIASWVLNSRKLVAWETKRETAIDYNICRLVVPGSLSGTLMGVLLNRVLPSGIILAVLTVILIFISVSVARTAHRQHTEEVAEDLRDAQATLEVEEPSPGLLVGKGLESAGKSGAQQVQKRVVKIRVGHTRRPSMNAPDITKIRNRWLWRDVVLAFSMLLLVVVLGVLRFHLGQCLRAGLESASPELRGRACDHPSLFWLGQGTLEALTGNRAAARALWLLAVIVPLGFCATVASYYGFLLVSHERWRPCQVVSYCLMAVGSGVLAGLCGIGGGLIFAPFFLLMGVHPSVAVASSSTCVIFTSASTALQYFLTDRIILSLAVFYGAVNIVAAYLGTSFVHFLQDRFWARKSLVSFVVFLGVSVSTVLAAIKLFSKQS
mmetsp:Transcript_79479/g.224788  ORF Transcript_79479/g.224788 Transcript_79479/m.224788 type:complete len:530 (+) Transcript_79479:87-1676(+)